MNHLNGDSETPSPNDPRHQLGLLGERLASEYLYRKGYYPIAERYRTRFGEVDLIVCNGPILVFVEVKSRISASFGKATESVDAHKLHRISRVAHSYIHRYNWEGDWRIDVIGLEFSSTHELLSIEHFCDVPP